MQRKWEKRKKNIKKVKSMQKYSIIEVQEC